MTIGEKIRAIRTALGMNQLTFGKELGVTDKLISAVEKGRVKPSSRVMELLFIKFPVNRVWWDRTEGEILQEREGPEIEKDAPFNLGPSLEDQLAYREWQTLSPDQKLEAIRLLRKLKADH